MSKIERILEHYFATSADGSRKDGDNSRTGPSAKARVPIPFRSAASIIERLQDIICRRRMPLFALFSSLCDEIWAEVLKKGSNIVANQQYWPSIRRQIVARESVDLIQMIQDSVLKSYFVKFLNQPGQLSPQGWPSSQGAAAGNRNLICLQCFEVVSLLISSVEYTRRKPRKSKSFESETKESKLSPVDSEPNYHIPGDSRTRSPSSLECPYADPVKTFGILLTDARTLYQQFFSEQRTPSTSNSGSHRNMSGNAHNYVMVAGVSDSTKYELASILQETASIYLSSQTHHTTSLTGSHDVDDGLYAIDPAFALEHALHIEKVFLAIETECFRHLQLLYAKFTESI
jgi:hypothetical protein